MTAARDALADGRLTDAVREQTAAVDADPSPSARLFLFELLVLAGCLTAARAQLDAITSGDPLWPASRLHPSLPVLADRGGFSLVHPDRRNRKGPLAQALAHNLSVPDRKRTDPLALQNRQLPPGAGPPVKAAR